MGYRLGLIDRLVTFRKKVVHTRRINDTCVCLVCENPRCVYLKFSYAGNVQYHKILPYHLQDFIDALTISQDMFEGKRPFQDASEEHGGDDQ